MNLNSFDFVLFLCQTWAFRGLLQNATILIISETKKASHATIAAQSSVVAVI